MASKVVKATTKGQVTLPKAWRDQFETDNFLLIMRSKQIVIKPLYLEEHYDEAGEEVIFDAYRDNDGKGVDPEEIIKMIEDIDGQDK